ncbi:hypothetical protein [Nocardia sp. NPDC024068]|uniref:hypothetical protein n=1 Tax=Nocardia sp. NPDC024068 TaxID=3157197 RepID=UPI00340F6039
MSAESHRWLYTSSDARAAIAPEIPTIGYPFGRSDEYESSCSGSSGVSVEDPRAMHGRTAAFAKADTAGGVQRARPVDSAASSHDRDPVDEPAPVPGSGIPTDLDHAVEPMPQAQAIAQVRQYVFSCASGASQATPGRLSADRFNVGWVVSTPAVGGRRDTPVYYVCDDGELEETSSAVETSGYVKSVEQRFFQRRALFG